MGSGSSKSGAAALSEVLPTPLEKNETQTSASSSEAVPGPPKQKAPLIEVDELQEASKPKKDLDAAKFRTSEDEKVNATEGSEKRSEVPGSGTSEAPKGSTSFRGSTSFSVGDFMRSPSKSSRQDDPLAASQKTMSEKPRRISIGTIQAPRGSSSFSIDDALRSPSKSSRNDAGRVPSKRRHSVRDVEDLAFLRKQAEKAETQEREKPKESDPLSPLSSPRPRRLSGIQKQSNFDLESFDKQHVVTHSRKASKGNF
eukprot:TRINITY_DN10699_c0_g1_i1.p1 TRINITY_DN10699_c0_g1~~TRINITY_DN10699_c0_g1_i1.p1  ORF type:complete len:256 (+),score=38.96 TRINITY_DN10699_c0_g1_i1:61-828(+)